MKGFKAHMTGHYPMANARRIAWRRGRRGDPLTVTPHPPFDARSTEGTLGPARIFSRTAEHMFRVKYGPDWPAMMQEPYAWGQQRRPIDEETAGQLAREGQRAALRMEKGRAKQRWRGRRKTPPTPAGFLIGEETP